jgi:hypothetical protein
MKTKWMMSASALLLGAAGVVATFLPQEIASALGAAGSGPTVLLLQVAGGLYLGFAMLNWSVRDMVVGGIYNRPVVLGNLLHFIVVGMTLVRLVAGGERRPGLLAASAAYALFAIWFGRTLMTSPVARNGAPDSAADSRN